MFGNANSKDKPGGMETIIGQDTLIQGTLSSKGSIRIDGKLEGGITEAAQVVVGAHGEIQGDILATSIVIGGKVHGNVVSTTSLEILNNAQIHGDIKAATLNIAEGAVFEGNCTMTREEHVIEMGVKPALAKDRR